MLGVYNAITCQRVANDENLITYKNGKHVQLNFIKKIMIQALISRGVENGAISYKNFVYERVIYHAITYNKMSKRNNSIVEMATGNYIEISGLYIDFFYQRVTV